MFLNKIEILKVYTSPTNKCANWNIPGSLARVSFRRDQLAVLVESNPGRHSPCGQFQKGGLNCFWNRTSTSHRFWNAQCRLCRKMCPTSKNTCSNHELRNNMVCMFVLSRSASWGLLENMMNRLIRAWICQVIDHFRHLPVDLGNRAWGLRGPPVNF